MYYKGFLWICQLLFHKLSDSELATPPILYLTLVFLRQVEYNIFQWLIFLFSYAHCRVPCAPYSFPIRKPGGRGIHRTGAKKAARTIPPRYAAFSLRPADRPSEGCGTAPNK